MTSTPLLSGTTRKSKKRYGLLGLLFSTVLVVTTLFVPAALLFGEQGEENTLRLLDSSLSAGEELMIGEPFEYQLRVAHALDLELSISSPPEGSRWRELDRQISTTEEGAEQITKIDLRFAIFRPGPTAGPPITVQGLPREGDVIQALEVYAHPVEVISLTTNEDLLRDPDGALPVWRQRNHGPILAATTVTTFLAALFGLLWLRRRRRPLHQVPLPPAEEALRDLELLRDWPVEEKERLKAFYQRLSLTLRRYLGRRYGFPGAEFTTTEVVMALNKIVADTDAGEEVPLSEIKRWLESCDQVKFAGFLPAPSKARGDLDQAVSFVEATRPPPSEEDDENQNKSANSTSSTDATKGRQS